MCIPALARMAWELSDGVSYCSNPKSEKIMSKSTSRELLTSDSPVIPYRPKLCKLIGDVKAAILLEQIVYWWEKQGCKSFYKFTSPPLSDHPKYRVGDSWTEELNFSESEFNTARRKIAAKVFKGSSKAELLETHYVLYWTDRYRVTHYQLNEPFLTRRLRHFILNAAGSDRDGSRADAGSTVRQDSSQENPGYIDNTRSVEHIERADPSDISSFHGLPKTTPKDYSTADSFEPTAENNCERIPKEDPSVMFGRRAALLTSILKGESDLRIRAEGPESDNFRFLEDRFKEGLCLEEIDALLDIMDGLHPTQLWRKGIRRAECLLWTDSENGTTYLESLLARKH